MIEVTLTITSCGRLDLLERTINSFNSFNTYPIAQRIIVDDSADEQIHNQLIRKYSKDYTLLMPYNKTGQLKCIDTMMEHIETDYVMAIEDDWLFYRSGFIEKALSVLEKREKIIQVWLRPKSDGFGHNIEPKGLLVTNNGAKIPYKLIMQQNGLNGFSFNPHLKRMKDYDKPYCKIGKENDIGKYYINKGFRTAILEEGYCKHIGFGRSAGQAKWKG